MKALCADERIWGGAPPEEYYIPADKQTKAQRVRFKVWQDGINKKWAWMDLCKYLMANNLTSQELSDEELNKFKRNP